MKFKKEDVLP